MPPEALEIYEFDGGAYTVGASYPYHELPPGVQEDIQAQASDIEVYYNVPAELGTYRLIVVPHEALVRMLQTRFGKTGFKKRLRSGVIERLAKKIDQEGLQQPPVLEEGFHRALALALLGWDMPYFTIDQMIVPFHDAPSLQGRRNFARV